MGLSFTDIIMSYIIMFIPMLIIHMKQSLTRLGRSDIVDFIDF